MLKQWLDQNKKILKGRPVDEIAHLAILVGFTIEEISATLPTWHMDLLTHTTHRQREAYFVDREVRTLSHYRGNVDLSEQWHHLYYQIEYGRDFE